MNDKSIIIIGAGIGGLSTGVLLVNKKIKVEIFEKSKKVGGRARKVNSRYSFILPCMGLQLLFGVSILLWLGLID